MDRRQFVVKTAQGAAAAGGVGLGWLTLLIQQAHAASPMRPPGALVGDGFSGACIKCGQCVQACPYHSIRLIKTGEPGLAGLPTITPRDIPCYMCEQLWCVKACPTGALDPLLTDVTQARMGLAVIDPEHCLSWLGLRCEVCYRVCPLKGTAITLHVQQRQISKHAMFVPVVHSEACTGCGICEKQCPTQLASIRVLDPALVQGKVGEHYRLGWKHEQYVAPLPGQDGTAAPAAPAAPAPAQPDTLPKALDYLNRGKP
jgi:ferredoxin-type protein NapG